MGRHGKADTECTEEGDAESIRETTQSYAENRAHNYIQSERKKHVVKKLKQESNRRTNEPGGSVRSTRLIKSRKSFLKPTMWPEGSCTKETPACRDPFLASEKHAIEHFSQKSGW